MDPLSRAALALFLLWLVQYVEPLTFTAYSRSANSFTPSQSRATVASASSSSSANTPTTTSPTAFFESTSSLSSTSSPLSSSPIKSNSKPPFTELVTEDNETRDHLTSYVKSHGGSKPIHRILIANNGMAAKKSITSMREWAYMQFGSSSLLHFVVMATPEDVRANAEFIRMADTVVEVPGGKNSNNYANVDLIVNIAKMQKVDGVWPGWGHASENPKLPTKLKALGIKFIGPSSSVMSVLGDKIAANILAQTSSVPSIPWSGSWGGGKDRSLPLTAELNDKGEIDEFTFNQATCHNADEAAIAANKIGYENGIMIKASEGGGGKGIRFVENEKDLRNAFIQVEFEVLGSPIFLMQLCKNARHLEVQIVGDEHGNAVALNGRDCSTQRRFQKIFEEAPPIIAPPATFRLMEKAAQRLTQSIGYVGAGTVEYLFNADTGKYFFLELNPRLQVEHPVTEGITNVNLPATQLQVAMGIPLNRIPDIRRFYGRLDFQDGSDKIDFLNEEYKKIKGHVIAARITAENPDEGFKPTSGTIERIKFHSTSDVWGYFSVGDNGGIHEFADSQFGHLFAKGPTREHARKSLILALKEIEVKGEIRTTTEYLIQLLETDEFKSNTIDTAWLDRLIKRKEVKITNPPHLVVTGAAVFKAVNHVKKETEALINSLAKGQTSMMGISNINDFNIEVSFLDVKYDFLVSRIAPDCYRFTIAGQTFDVKIRESPEGALLAIFAGKTHRILAMDEPLGLRLSLDGITTIMPSIFDPSELRTDVTGKIVRYLHEPNAEVKAGETYVEVEAMKMIMSIKATETGTISHAIPPGSVISAGDLLATLTLKDAGKVKKILPFNSKFEITSSANNAGYEVLGDAKAQVAYALAGYKIDAEKVAATALQGVTDVEVAASIVSSTLNEYARVEEQFDGKINDDVVREMCKTHKGKLDTVISLNMANQQLGQRNKLVLALLRQVESFGDRFGSIPKNLQASLQTLTKLNSKQYGEITLTAGSILREAQVPSFEKRKAELRALLLSSDLDLDIIAKQRTSGVGLISSLFDDEEEEVRIAALEVYVRRVYRAFRIVSLDTRVSDGRLTASWKFQFADTVEEKSPIRTGQMSILNNFAQLTSELPSILSNMETYVEQNLAETPEYGINNIHFALTEGNRSLQIDHVLAKEYAAVFTEPKIKSRLEKLKIRTANILIPAAPKAPRFFTFPQSRGFSEDPLRRNMRPTFHHLLELGRLQPRWDLKRVQAVGKNAQVYLGTERSKNDNSKASPQVVFVRAVSHSPDVATAQGASRALLSGLDELERARLVSDAAASGRIYLHSLPEAIETTTEGMVEMFKHIMNTLKSKHATRLLKLRVDEIEVKLRIVTNDEHGKVVVKPIRLIASSMSGEWLKVSAYKETIDCMTGVTKEFCLIDSDGGEATLCTKDPYGMSSIVQAKRAVARRVGSTYAYDFLGLLEVGLVEEWESYLSSLAKADATRSSDAMPQTVFKSEELIFDSNNVLVKNNSRRIGTNANGMIAWHVLMKTPEYPNGRDVVFVANDVTVESGSFGVEEDDFYYAASVYARKLKIPRVYIACNAGARIGLVDELKPLFQVKFTDPNAPQKGFEYLYLRDADYKNLPIGTVNAEKCAEGWKLVDIIGTKHGIGVENLQGSGMIAGETSRAYEEIFTLSYVTGRSVGIGAYIVRLGQRIIQNKQAPMLLTGYSALNKLLGREVYTSQDQLGGPQVMYPNGVTHEVVDDDQAGVSSILRWLSYVPKDAGSLPAARESADPVDRDVQFMPTKTPYDPRNMLAGTKDASGFFDRGSFAEYLAGWGKSVIVGRARLGGIPVGTIAVETRMVEQRIPADPANPESREAILPQAGQVWHPDSSFKTAQAIKDFGHAENLPLIIFSNWRGFSGGTRDMAGEVLKFGSMIVDALREYKHPVFVYIPPFGELRGGSWVVIDSTINIEMMEMYADVDSRGGILEPAGICEVKFRKQDQLSVMHRTDSELVSLGEELDACQVDSDAITLKKRIHEREVLLLPLFMQVAHQFADLHDRSGRMKAKGVIRDVVKWPRSREFFFYRVKRRLVVDGLIKDILNVSKEMKREDAASVLKELYNGDWEDDRAVLAWFEGHEGEVKTMIGERRKRGILMKIKELNLELGAD